MMTNNYQKYPKDFEALEEYGVDPALYLPRNPRRIEPKPLNKGLLAFNSRQKELDLGGEQEENSPTILSEKSQKNEEEE